MSTEAQRWVAEIVYDADGTQMASITGDRISMQLIPNPDGSTRSLTIARDAEGNVTEMFLAARTYSIHKKRTG